ncbi:MAG: SsrA-binding protein SmpB [Candidatus Babeliales bacterium]
MKNEGIKMRVIAKNRKAYFDYEIVDTIEAGIVLLGDEVKSLRAGHVSLVGAFATVKSGELFLINCMISPYAKAHQKRDDLATRSRKLLLHKKQLKWIIGDISKKGVTIIPLEIYANERNIMKVKLGICKHKKAASKKKEKKERDISRQTERELKENR